MRNKKGFTLIELVAVIIIMGLIMLMVFPSLSRLMASNDKRKYDEYYKLIEGAANKYSRDRNDDLGGTKGSGCIDDVTLEDLEREGLIKSYDESGVVCTLPNKLDLSAYDIDTSRDYVNIRIRNDYGKITVEHSLVCVDNNSKLLYSNLVEKKGTCDKYVVQNTNLLFNAINGKGNPDGDVYFLTTNNYVIYSGATWRIVSYNIKTKTIKLVLNEPITLLNFDSFSNEFPNSNVDIWLNETFRDYLKNYTKYLDYAYWDYSAVSTQNGKPSGTNTIQRYVGLLNTYEYDNNNSIQSANKIFLLNKSTTSNNIWVAGQGSSNINGFYLVRPSIVLKQNVPYASGGNGSATNPFKLVGEQTALQGSALNSRFIGEYVRIGSSLFRIIGINGRYTKLVLNGVITESATPFDNTNIEIYSPGSTMGDLLNTTWYDSAIPDEIKQHVLGNENPEEASEFCTSKYSGTTKYQINCTNTDIVTAKVGALKVGDFYAIGSLDGNYWTLSRGEPLQNNVISTSNGITSTNINSTNYARPVLALDKTTEITGGAGTSTSPYTIK